jgi:hypothetical protein
MKSIVIAMLILSFAGSAEAQRRRRPAAKPAPQTVTSGVQETTEGGGNKKIRKTFDFTALGIEGKVLTPQLMYLLGRIQVELERATLETRSFMPELARSVDEGGL